ncbi:MAG: homocysteine S-methyltransferase family protein, partial [Candidatus Latescibacterota bacterium]
MSDFLHSLQRGPLLADGAMGSLLFERTGRLSEPNHVYEAFNADRPDLVLQVHLAYLQAGARCLTTNTFGAGRAQLAAYGLAHRTPELNRAGVAVARRAIGDFVEQSRAEGPFHVLGSIGPHDEPTGGDDEQLRALVEAGVDAVLLETFVDLEQATSLVERLRVLAPDLPVVVGMALQQRPEGGWNLDPVRFVDRMAELDVAAAGVNCCAPREALAFLDAVGELPAVRERRVLLSAMPNGADFHRIGHRYLTGVNPEYMGNLARQLVDRGVALVGGCCEVHPPHLAEMHNYLQGRLVGRDRIWASAPAATLPPISDEVKRTNGPLSRKLKDGGFAVSVEM